MIICQRENRDIIFYLHTDSENPGLKALLIYWAGVSLLLLPAALLLADFFSN